MKKKKSEMPPEYWEAARKSVRKVIEEGCPVSAFDRAIEVRIAIASAFGAISMKIEEKETRNNVYSYVMQYLSDASDEEMLELTKINVPHAGQRHTLN